MAPSHKRPSVDARAPLSPDCVVKKTERSHEENQERAYIAASRRQDRSIEARVQSARMASEIHKKRTGKAFRITEDIVRKEEMYEEEEDDLPRSFRMLSTHMQTDSPEFNARIEAWMTNRWAMSQYMQAASDEWNDNHINRMFAQNFPNATAQAAQITSQMGMPSPGFQQGPQSPHPQQQQQQQVTSPTSPTFPQQSVPKVETDPLSPHSRAQDSSVPTTPAPQFQPFPQQQEKSQSVFTSDLPPEMMSMIPDFSTQMQDNVYTQNGANMFGDDSYYDMATPGQSDFPSKFNPSDFDMSSYDTDHNMGMLNTDPQWDSFLTEDDDMWSGQD